MSKSTPSQSLENLDSNYAKSQPSQDDSVQENVAKMIKILFKHYCLSELFTHIQFQIIDHIKNQENLEDLQRSIEYVKFFHNISIYEPQCNKLNLKFIKETIEKLKNEDNPEEFFQEIDKIKEIFPTSSYLGRFLFLDNKNHLLKTSNSKIYEFTPMEKLEHENIIEKINKYNP